MEFKCLNDRNKTPQSKCVFSSTTNNERFFNLSQNLSTPPSRFSKIVNPFECRLVDRLHLPTFSPSLFAKQSTPKSGEFKWTIEDISSFRPADIDEETISQHVFEEDPHMESLVQKKIDEFFSEKVIVPSPMTNNIIRVPLIAHSPDNLHPLRDLKESSEASTQTMLSLPPVLPAHIEDILKPYFLPVENEREKRVNSITELKNSTLFRNLFNNCNMESPTDDHIDIEPPSPLSKKGLTPVPPPVQLKGRYSLEGEIPDLQDCSLSPIGGHNNTSSKECRSAMRLDFLPNTSMNASLAVPDLCLEVSNCNESLEISQNFLGPEEQLLSDSPINWDMEQEHVSFISPNSSPDSNRMDISNANTPHSKIFTSQRKRLSHSFNIEKDEMKKENDFSLDSSKQGRKLFTNDITDAGYHTDIVTFYDESKNSIHMFASTPTKTQKNEIEVKIAKQ